VPAWRRSPSWFSKGGEYSRLDQGKSALQRAEKDPHTGRAGELVKRAGGGIQKSVLASDRGISRETVYRYLRQAKLS